MRLGDAASKISVSTIPSGCLELDFALGVGGIPRGRIIEIYGPESSGKTTIALHIIAEAQKLGGTAAFIDAEHALDPVYAENLGVDVDELYVSQPDTGEDALEICETLVRSGKEYRWKAHDSLTVYCSQARLVIEIDGGQHYTEEGLAYDKERTKALEKHGLEVIRFTNREVDQQFDAVCQRIDQKIKERTVCE